jgi:hypothetical protein
MGQRGGSPDKQSEVGWVMQNRSDGPIKCMGDITQSVTQSGITYSLVAIEDPDKVTGMCKTEWQVVANREIVQDSHSILTARTCKATAFDGDWVDAIYYPQGDFAQEWFDKLTISSADNHLLAHTNGTDVNVPFAIEVNSSDCSITVHLQDGCDTCKAKGTLNAGGDQINWDTGLDNGFWVRKNGGCCTLFDATMKNFSTEALSLPPRTVTPEDLECAKKFNSSRWVDRSQGDFAFSWVPYMELSAQPLEDDANGRMTAPIEQGSWTLPVNFFADGNMCKLQICLSGNCGDESGAISTGILNEPEINWDVRLNHGKWARQTPVDICAQEATAYSCCNMPGVFGCSFVPNKEVCDAKHGDFCCDPADPSADCGFEPKELQDVVV